MSEATETQTEFVPPTAEQAIERWKIGVSPPESLIKEQNEIDRFLWLDEKQAASARRNLPLVFLENMQSLSVASFGIEERAGKLVGTIAFRSPGMLDGDDSYSRWGRSEELVHHLHCAANPRLAGDSAREHQLIINYAGVSEAPALLEKAQRYAAGEIARFTARVGLDPVSAPKSPDELFRAIKYSLGESTSQSPGTDQEAGKLSVGQLARINTALDEKGLGETDAFGKEMLQKYTRTKKYLSGKAQQGEADEWWQGRTREARSSAEYNLRRRISNLIKTAKPEERDGTVSKISDAFGKALVPMDRIGYRVEEIMTRIDGLNNDQVKNTLILYLSQPCTVEELNIISGGLIGNIDWVQTYLSLEKAGKVSLDEAEEIRSKNQALMLEALKTAQKVGVTENDGKQILKFLFMHARAVAVSQAMTEKELFWFSDDLPADPMAREKLLRNPEFVKAYEEAVTKALQDPELSLLGDADINPQFFSKDKLEALQSTRKALKNALKKPEEAAFVSTIKDRASFQKSGLGTRFPEQLEISEAEDVDDTLLEMGIPLDQIPDESTYTEAKLRTFQKSMEKIKERQEEALLRHKLHIMLEPIAKVITAQHVGRKREDIIFPESLMGSYSELLRTEDFRGWVDRLWRFVEVMRAQRNGRAFLEFFQANSIEEQTKVVDKYLGLKK